MIRSALPRSWWISTPEWPTLRPDTLMRQLEPIENLGMLEIGDPRDNREGHKSRMTLARSRDLWNSTNHYGPQRSTLQAEVLELGCKWFELTSHTAGTTIDWRRSVRDDDRNTSVSGREHRADFRIHPEPDPSSPDTAQS